MMTRKTRMSVMSLTALGVVFVTAVVQAQGAAPTAVDQQIPSAKTFRIEAKISAAAGRCIECHTEQNPGLVADWAASRHAHARVTCLDCHGASKADADMVRGHLQYDVTPISTIVSPRDCSRCHPGQAAEYARSKHANTLELIWKIDPWLNHGMNNTVERVTGCQHCHGSVVAVRDGKFDPETWPNVGVGRVNPDGSRGSCSSCHTRHRFSLAEARRPESCGQCHLGPDHPQMEIYRESKHGALYYDQGDAWNWDAAPGAWTAGVDYRTPTCATCHMSAAGDVPGTHDATERLAWETQAPLTVRPSEFKPWPAATDWKTERQKMRKVCLACHSPAWADGHFEHMDQAIANYNDEYYRPAKKIIDGLYAKKLLDPTRNLDERLEVEMYELWHHEGRRARFGAAMMAPDYAWWHGFYELKKRFMEIETLAAQLEASGKPGHVHDVPGTGGSTTVPDVLKPKTP